MIRWKEFFKLFCHSITEINNFGLKRTERKERENAWKGESCYQTNAMWWWCADESNELALIKSQLSMEYQIKFHMHKIDFQLIISFANWVSDWMADRVRECDTIPGRVTAAGIKWVGAQSFQSPTLASLQHIQTRIAACNYITLSLNVVQWDLPWWVVEDSECR